MEDLSGKTLEELMQRLKEITLLNKELEAEYYEISHELWERINKPSEEMKLERTKDELQGNSR